MHENVLTVKLTPKASKNEIQGWQDDGQGGNILKVSVTAIPEKGKANRALIKLLAKKLKLPASSISIISGETSRIKKVKIDASGMEMLQF